MLDELELAGRMALLAEIAPQLTPQDQLEVHEILSQFEASADFCQALQVLGYHHSISKVLVSKALTLKRERGPPKPASASLLWSAAGSG